MIPDGVIVIIILALPILVVLFYLDLRRLIMASKKDVEDKIAEVQTAVNTGFETLGQSLMTETKQVIDAINAGGDKASTLNTGINDIVTPPKPPEPPAETSVPKK